MRNFVFTMGRTAITLEKQIELLRSRGMIINDGKRKKYFAMSDITVLVFIGIRLRSLALNIKHEHTNLKQVQILTMQ